VWNELERRGEDLSDLRVGIARTLPLIAAGRLAAEAVVAFAGRPAHLRALEGLPLPDQRRLAAGDSIDVVMPDDERTVERMPIAQIPAARLRLILDEKVLSPTEQRVRLGRLRRPKAPREEQSERRYNVRVDRDVGLVYVGRMAVPLADVLTALGADAGPERMIHHDLPDEYKTAHVKLLPDEHAALTEQAARCNLPAWELIRKALRAFGLLGSNRTARGD